MGSPAAADSLQVLIQSLRRPLEYLSTTSVDAASRASLPSEPLAEKVRQVLLVTDDADTRVVLQDLVDLLERFDSLAAAEKIVLARKCLQAIDGVREVIASETVGERKVSRREYGWSGDIEEALAALKRPVQFVKGVGPKRAAEFQKMGIETVEDLLFHLPFRYEDRRRIVPIGRAVVGESATFSGELVYLEEKIAGRARRRILEGVLRDDTGLLGLTWFNQAAYFRNTLRSGQRYSAYGRVDYDPNGGRHIVHPDLMSSAGERAPGILAVYNKPGTMSVKAMRKIVRQALRDSAHLVPSVLPQGVAAERELLRIDSALAGVHCPESDVDPDALAEFRSAAHRALIFDELFYLQMGLALRRRAARKAVGLAMERGGPMTSGLERAFPYAWTAAQQRVIREIAEDMAVATPMHRLVQGDVGSGKTVVAVYAALIAVQSGYQVAFMAPTELLAEQHCKTIVALLHGLDVRVEVFTGERLRSRRDEMYADLAAGKIDIAVGTHALIQEAVEIPRLGLGVIDEQHRFGVLQRAAMRGRRQGKFVPHILLMTATPIPRTLSMTVYGDLDVSRLDELPAGRKPVQTIVVHESDRRRVYATVRKEVEKGHQAYIVYPLVEASEKLDLLDATTMAQQLARTVFPDLHLGLVHGRMKAEEKEAVMRRFRSGDLDILVSTTVVEVGVDVANATVMVIEHAERFGLTQLHQLRGRVGRGGERSLCLLVSTRHATASDGDRLTIMRNTSDGFALAEADLRLRGPGELIGTRQSGLPEVRVANLLHDTELLVAAREAALAVLRCRSGPRSAGVAIDARRIAASLGRAARPCRDRLDPWLRFIQAPNFGKNLLSSEPFTGRDRITRKQRKWR